MVVPLYDTIKLRALQKRLKPLAPQPGSHLTNFFVSRPSKRAGDAKMRAEGGGVGRSRVDSWRWVWKSYGAAHRVLGKQRDESFLGFLMYTLRTVGKGGGHILKAGAI
jgi:hypothetical protein